MKRLYKAPEMNIKTYLQNDTIAAVVSDPDLENKDHWVEVPLG